jgi:hypothetical protein
MGPLDNLHLEWYDQASEAEQQDIEPFIISRQHPAHPITVHRLEPENAT